MKLRTLTPVRARQGPIVPGPKDPANVLGVIPAGKVVEAQLVPNSPGWIAIRLQMNGFDLDQSATAAFSPFAYALMATPATPTAPAQQLFEPVKDEPPPVERSPYEHARYLLGVNVLTNHEMGWDALRAGCRCVLLMNNGGAALAMAKAYPDATIIYRHYRKMFANPETVVEELDLNLADAPSNLHITLSNEADWGNDLSPDRLEQYHAWFVRAAIRAWQINRKVVLAYGTWGHGNPDWTNPDTARIWKTLCVPWLNAHADTVVCDLHTYTKGRRRKSHPPADAPIYGTEWYETRYTMAYSNGLSVEVAHISGEGGVEGGSGGFVNHGYTAQQFREWCYDVVGAHRAQRTRIKGVALYTLSHAESWKGYWLDVYLPVLQELWRNDIPYGVTI